LDKKIIETPTLFIQATYDSVLKPEMAKNMESFLPNLTRADVAATHWALTQKPEEVNSIIRKWLENQGFGTSRSSL
jgi:pimeloyl-ACP methyl ester carboxylesterase